MVDLDSDAVLDQARAGQLTLRLPVGNFLFELAPRPLAAGAVIGHDGIPGGVVRDEDTVTFVGLANGDPAVLAATQLGVFAAIRGANDIMIEPLWKTQPGASLALHRVTVAFGSTTEALKQGYLREHPAQVLGVPTPPAPANRMVHFLIEGDAAFYEKTNPNGACPDCWIQVQQAHMLLAEAWFRPQTGVTFVVTGQWICRSMSACPYQGVDPDVILESFIAKWEGVSGEAEHDLGHLMTGVNLAGVAGTATQATVNTPRGYAISEFVVPSAGGGIGTPIVTAHEIGHNFDGSHGEALPWTIMNSVATAQATFTDGTLFVTKNNLARIVNHAVQQLPS